MTATAFPQQGVIFWPVGTGDSTTIMIDDDHVVQVDLHDMVASDDDEIYAPIIDRLMAALPERDGHPYLAAFALTHADLDHCKGFGDLLDSDIHIGEIWATPRLWREYAEDEGATLCEDAQRFHDEAERRVMATLDHIKAGREIPSGDRVRVIGYDRDLDDENHPYRDLPAEHLSFPGDTVTTIDGADVGDLFEAFIHAPFKDDCAAERNDTSLAMQVMLKGDGVDGRALLLGDLAYATLRRIFDLTQDAEHLAWDLLLAPHHCSHRVMYALGADGEEELKQDIMDDFDANRRDTAYVVASSNLIPRSNKPGDNPPHAKAKARYQELGIEQFLCTQEHGDVDAPHPIVFALEDSGLALQAMEAVRESAAGVKTLAAIGLAAAIGVGGTLAAARAAVKRARGADAAPAKPVGFGRARDRDERL